ncbi:hypothetical protein ACHAWU_004079 [Discostella pseudostelligera]|uniref:Uncharacterized protein n=1 Tax=Discostella pseudostelligera TaxID=259834 RepID=A0ABD3ML90_9STRA
MSSFSDAVKGAINSKYHSSMRRSLQSVVLYEADRCLNAQYPVMKPFQRKWALVATAIELLKSLDFLNDYQRQEIMFRTGTSKEQLPPVLAWRRMKLIAREISQTILPNAQKLVEEGPTRSHDEICELLLEMDFAESNAGAKNHPATWEFKHSSVFTVYRIYYRGITAEPNVFPIVPPPIADTPAKKNVVPVAAKTERVSPKAKAPSANQAVVDETNNAGGDLSSVERIALLTEIKVHTDLLSGFQGVIPDEELAARKRALYAALPPPPKKYKGAK